MHKIKYFMDYYVFIFMLLTKVLLLIVYLAFKYARNSEKRKSIAQNINSNPVKGVLLVRNDLKMTKGKIVAQAMHAAYSSASTKNPLAERWKSNGFKKVSLKVETEEEMNSIIRKAKEKKIPFNSIIDAGRTQVMPNTHTVTFIGPWYEDVLDSITGHLKLL